jgi:hypothetical protein
LCDGSHAVAHSLTFAFLPFSRLSPYFSELGLLANILQMGFERNRKYDNIVVWMSCTRCETKDKSSLDQLFSLSHLNKCNAELSGTIPKELGRLQKANSIRFAGNKLMGTIPTELGTLATIQNLGFDDNQLTGKAPAEVCARKNSLFFFFLYVDCSKIECDCWCCLCHCFPEPGSLLSTSLNP